MNQGASAPFGQRHFDELAEARFSALFGDLDLSIPIEERSNRNSILPIPSLANLLHEEASVLRGHDQIRAHVSTLPIARMQPGGEGKRTDTDTSGDQTTPLPPSEHWLDRYAISALKRSGSHAFQLGVAVDGKLKYLKAFTHAEEGYPVCTVRNNLYFASCWKPFLTMALIRAKGATWVRQTRLREALGFSFGTPINQAAFDALTIEHLMRHMSGEAISWDDLNLSLGQNNAYSPNPGDYARYFPIAARPLFRFVPSPPLYSNNGFDILGEVLGYQAVGSPALFDVAFRAAWSDIGSYDRFNMHLRRSSWVQTIEEGDALRHELRPSWAGNPVANAQPLVIPNVLATVRGFDAGSGEMVTPVGEALRILSSLSPGAAAPPVLDDDSLAFIDEPFVDGQGNSYSPPLTFIRSFMLPNRIVLDHNGAYLGGAAWVAHARRAPMAPVGTREVTMAFAHDTGNLRVIADPNFIMQTAVALAEAGVWDDNEDLFSIFP